ncbi:glycosyltransferase family 9 protein [uncultured Chloroflexus sp.]|uniref:glycosyltransferase family 9 protein n=1 Tax=uncultured Chloroflexus sp. TaxID=214040 RepID=UPI0026144480|nr:glycosyltransferase family 9 protein [uncultured Chloroflexus sp.]
MHPSLLRLLAAVARPLVRRMPANPAQRVLIIKPDHLGDLLLATPALAALREALPTAHLTGLVGPWAATMWQRLPELNALETLPFPAFDRAAAKPMPLAPYTLLLRAAWRLRRQCYDAALILRDDHWWGAALALLAGIPHRIGFAHPLCQPLLSVALPYDPRQHVTQQALDLVAALTSAKPAPGPLRFSPTPAAQEWAKAWLHHHSAPEAQVIILHPGTGGPTKHWLREHWMRLIQGLRQPGRRIVLTGSPTEGAELAAIAAAQPDVLTLSADLTIDRLAALLSYAALVIGVDSGPLHIAVSQGVPTIHLFGPSDPRRFGPWGDPARQRVISANLPCSPCGVFAACPRATDPPECMAAIQPAHVLTVAETMLLNQRRHTPAPH